MMAETQPDPAVWRTRHLRLTDLGPEVEHTQIADLGEPGYIVLKTIPVEIKRIDADNVEASFQEANIAMVGVNPADALQALTADILDTFDTLLQARALAPPAVEQLRVLRTYIART